MTSNPVTFVLQTERLTLRQFTLDDTAFIIELVNSPGWLENIGDRNIHSPEQALSYLQNGPMASYAQHGYGLYRVALKPNDVPIGMCGLLKRDTLPQPDIGFALLPDYSGKGYAYEAANAVRTLAFEQFNLPALLAITLPSNQASIRLLEKIGLRYAKPFWHNNEELWLYKEGKKC